MVAVKRFFTDAHIFRHIPAGPSPRYACSLPYPSHVDRLRHFKFWVSLRRLPAPRPDARATRLFYYTFTCIPLPYTVPYTVAILLLLHWIRFVPRSPRTPVYTLYCLYVTQVRGSLVLYHRAVPVPVTLPGRHLPAPCALF